MKRPLDTASSGHRAQNQLAMNDLPRCLKTCIAPAAGANHKLPSGEGKKELWRRNHTLQRCAAQATGRAGTWKALMTTSGRIKNPVCLERPRGKPSLWRPTVKIESKCGGSISTNARPRISEF